jgi:hypothetical protein
VAESAVGSGPSAGRAQDVLEALSTVVGYDCAGLSYLDPGAGRLRALATVGYWDGFDEATGVAEYREEHARLHMHARNRPLRFSDLPDRGAATFTATELAWPLGLRGGLGMALYARDGRETGFLSVNTVGADGIGDAERDLIALLGGVLGEVTDVLGALAERFRGQVLLGPARSSPCPEPASTRCCAAAQPPPSCCGGWWRIGSSRRRSTGGSPRPAAGIASSWSRSPTPAPPIASRPRASPRSSCPTG